MIDIDRIKLIHSRMPQEEKDRLRQDIQNLQEEMKKFDGLVTLRYEDIGRLFLLRRNDVLILAEIGLKYLEEMPETKIDEPLDEPLIAEDFEG